MNLYHDFGKKYLRKNLSYLAIAYSDPTKSYMVADELRLRVVGEKSSSIKWTKCSSYLISYFYQSLAIRLHTKFYLRHFTVIT